MASVEKVALFCIYTLLLVVRGAPNIAERLMGNKSF
jgi:hypothetical protein